MTPKRIAASSDGVELAYWAHQAKTAGGRLLLLIHGGASNHTRWSEFVATTRLRDEWNIIAPDMRGNGASITRAHVNMATWCADLSDLLDAENAESAVILGHSLGAQIALHFADRYPDKTGGLILIDPVFQCSLQGRSLWVRRYRWLIHVLVAIILGLNALGLRRKKFQIQDLQELDKKTRKALREADSFEEIARRYSALGPILRSMPVTNYLRQALATVSPLPPLEEINAPVLTLLSGGTTMSDLERNRREAERFTNSEVITLNANHWPLTEAPDAVREGIEEWVLRALLPSTAPGEVN